MNSYAQMNKINELTEWMLDGKFSIHIIKLFLNFS